MGSMHRSRILATEPLTLKLRVAGERVHGDLERFPVRVDLVLPAGARAAAGSGMRVRDSEGEVPHRLSADPATGRVEGWIEVPRLERGSEMPGCSWTSAPAPLPPSGFTDYALVRRPRERHPAARRQATSSSRAGSPPRRCGPRRCR